MNIESNGLTLTITATEEEWEAIKESLKSKNYDVTRQLCTAIHKAIKAIKEIKEKKNEIL